MAPSPIEPPAPSDRSAPPVPMEPGPDPDGPPPGSLFDQIALAAYFWRYVRPRRLVVLLTVCLILGGVVHLPVTFLPQVFLSRQDDPTGFGLYLMFALAALLVGWVLGLLETYWGVTLGETVVRTLRAEVFARLEWVDGRRLTSGPAEFVQQIGRDVMAVRDLFDASLMQAAGDVARGVAVFVALFVLDATLTLWIVPTVAGTAVVIYLLNRQVERHAGQARAQMQQITGRLVEYVGGLRDILAAGRFGGFGRRFADLLLRHQRANVRTALWGQLAGLLPPMLVALGMIGVFALGAFGDRPPDRAGETITYALLLAQLVPALHALTELGTELAMATPGLRALREVLEIRPGGPPGAIALDSPIEALGLDGVTVEIEGRTILDGVSLTLTPGRLTALVGPSGAGKTTVAQLILGLLAPTAGTVRVNGRPLADFTPASVRERIGYLPQNPFLLDTSLRENILFAVPADPGAAALHRAVDLARLGEVVDGRVGQGGLEATAGYLGSRLSGGERQRVALARLLLRDPPVIVCDEYTSSMDPRTARLVHDMLRTHFAGRTRLLITHELYLAHDADWVFVLDGGRVVQQGPPADLAATPGLYRDLASLQGAASIPIPEMF